MSLHFTNANVEIALFWAVKPPYDTNFQLETCMRRTSQIFSNPNVNQMNEFSSHLTFWVSCHFWVLYWIQILILYLRIRRNVWFPFYLPHLLLFTLLELKLELNSYSWWAIQKSTFAIEMTEFHMLWRKFTLVADGEFNRCTEGLTNLGNMHNCTRRIKESNTTSDRRKSYLNQKRIAKFNFKQKLCYFHCI